MDPATDDTLPPDAGVPSVNTLIPKEPAARIAMLVLAVAGYGGGLVTERYSGQPIDQSTLDKAVGKALESSDVMHTVRENVIKIREHDLRLSQVEKSTDATAVAMQDVRDLLVRLDERLSRVLGDENTYKKLKGISDITNGRGP